MKPFDLKKYLTENKATFHAALNEEAPYINPEADEIDDEDLEAASDYFDTMKESKLRSKIREMILAEMALDIDNMEDAPESEVDFLSELESMLDENLSETDPRVEQVIQLLNDIDPDGQTI